MKEKVPMNKAAVHLPVEVIHLILVCIFEWCPLLFHWATYESTRRSNQIISPCVFDELKQDRTRSFMLSWASIFLTFVPIKLKIWTSSICPNSLVGNQGCTNQTSKVQLCCILLIRSDKKQLYMDLSSRFHRFISVAYPHSEANKWLLTYSIDWQDPLQLIAMDLGRQPCSLHSLLSLQFLRSRIHQRKSKSRDWA